MDDYLSIPASVAIRAFNRATGADCRTLEETVRYLEDHPEARQLIELNADVNSFDDSDDD